ncbi:MAG TPA: DegT/DnrJ/EryC1/StrS family aminotransferase [Candidatus Obscuribacterales bacterium]
MSTKPEVIPLVDLQTQYQNLKPQIDAALEPVFQSAAYILGPDVERFEWEFAKFCQAKHCVTVNSGTAALQLALMACGIQPGDEVITATNSFIATAEAISFVGATPVFVDADPVTYSMDPGQLEAAIGPKAKAVIPVHLFGQPADMDPILEIAKRHKLKVIEDACQAHGATYKNRTAGSIGDVACFSFYPGKNLGAAGDAGAITTNDAAIAKHIQLLRNHGSAKKYEHEIIGHNFRMDTLQAAVLSVKLPHLAAWNEKRRELAAYYNARLSEIEGVRVPQVPSDRQSVFHLYVIEVADRQSVQAALSEAHVQWGIHYPKPIHLQKAYAHLNLGRGSFPTSERLADCIISLPLYPELRRDQQDKIIDVVALALEAASPDKKKLLTSVSS